MEEEMDWGMFVAGAVGALIAVYLAREQVIPEFRPLYDISAREVELAELREHTQRTEKELAALQTRVIAQPPPPEAEAQYLLKVRELSLQELRDERQVVGTLERAITRYQVISRGIGFILYVVLGGVIGGFLASRVDVVGLDGDFEPAIKAAVIGTAWTSYLAALGMRLGKEKIENRIEQVKVDTLQQLDSVQTRLMPEVISKMAVAETSDRRDKPVEAQQTGVFISDYIAKLKTDTAKRFEGTRLLVKSS
jgi:hypothetical protein